MVLFGFITLGRWSGVPIGVPIGVAIWGDFTYDPSRYTIDANYDID